MSAAVSPLVRHPETGKMGVFIPRSFVDGLRARGVVVQEDYNRLQYRAGVCVFSDPETHGYSEGAAWRGIRSETRAFLRANEFDPDRDIEFIRLPDGYGCFYL